MTNAATASRIAALRTRLAARAVVAAPAGVVRFLIGAIDCGVASHAVADLLARTAPRFDQCGPDLVLDDTDLSADERSHYLDLAAHRLLDAALIRGWRDEQLEVRPDPAAPALATIERAACRALGIATTAVHLNALAADGRIWVAQRALDKQIDPGLWDTLVGGMVPAGESELGALRREALEEASVDTGALALVTGGRLKVARPVPEGYQVETIQVFDAVLPDGAQPRNQDGEVAAIELRSADAVLDAIDGGEFTLEAALVTLDALARRQVPAGSSPRPRGLKGEKSAR